MLMLLSFSGLGSIHSVTDIVIISVQFFFFFLLNAKIGMIFPEIKIVSR